jgi:hypothetical protein
MQQYVTIVIEFADVNVDLRSDGNCESGAVCSARASNRVAKRARAAWLRSYGLAECSDCDQRQWRLLDSVVFVVSPPAFNTQQLTPR